MLLMKLLKYIAGYVIFTASGGFGERFINLCAVGRIKLWDVSSIGGKIKGKISVGDFKKLRSVARKTGVRVSIDAKVGLPFYVREHKDRVGLVVAVAFYVIFCIVMNRFVWCIEASDGKNYSGEQIIEVAESVGLRQGIYVSSFDEEKAAREIFKAFGGNLSWVKVNIKGSLAVVDYREKTEKLQIEEKGQPSNIVADFDGVIVSDEIYQGAKNISRGSAVKKGDILISGVVEGVDQIPLYYEAKGKYTALHSDLTELTLRCNSEFYVLSDIKEVYTLKIFGVRIPLGFVGYIVEDKSLMSMEVFAEYDSHILPFSLTKSTVATYEKIVLTPEHMKQIAVLNFSKLTYNKYRNTNILSSDIKTKMKNDTITISAEYKCIDFIGETKPIIIENAEN